MLESTRPTNQLKSKEHAEKGKVPAQANEMDDDSPAMAMAMAMALRVGCQLLVSVSVSVSVLGMEVRDAVGSDLSLRRLSSSGP
jgi:hypothetical protein